MHRRKHVCDDLEPRLARLMRQAGIQGVSCRCRWNTTKRDPKASPAADLVCRNFTAAGFPPGSRV